MTIAEVGWVPLEETGRQAVHLLLQAIAGEKVPERPPLLPVELIVRDSSGGYGGASRRADRVPRRT